MFESLTTYHLIIIFSITIIISYFFNLYAKKSGIPAVLLLIGLGIVINYALRISGFGKPDLLPILSALGVVGLILIVLEAALDLELVKEKIGLITKSLAVDCIEPVDANIPSCPSIASGGIIPVPVSEPLKVNEPVNLGFNCLLSINAISYFFLFSFFPPICN